MWKFICEKFEISSTTYGIREINERKLDIKRIKTHIRWNKKNETRWNVTKDGSSTFQVLVFSPHSDTVPTSKKFWVCRECKKECSSCSLIFNWRLLAHQRNYVSYWTQKHRGLHIYIYIGGSNENIDDSLFLGSFVAVTTDTMSDDTVWFIKVEQDLDGRSELSIETMAELFQQAFTSSVVNF